jgi:glyoxylase-like metal-dependent hydrolase (beta-lactamase superfamily II)
MTQPKCASEFQMVSDNLFVWSVYDPEMKCDLWSTLVKTSSGLVVIDPAPLAEAAWQELFELGQLRAILLTNGNHARAAVELRKAHPVPIVTAPETRREFIDFKPDVVLLPNELLYGIAPIAIPGATPGETAFFSNTGVMVLGDAVINVSTEKGLELLPDKYCEDAALNHESLKQLLAFDFHILTFAHGAPMTTHAKENLQALLNP